MQLKVNNLNYLLLDTSKYKTYRHMGVFKINLQCLFFFKVVHTSHYNYYKFQSLLDDSHYFSQQRQ